MQSRELVVLAPLQGTRRNFRQESQAAFYRAHANPPLYGLNKLTGQQQSLDNLRGWLVNCKA